jgi:hypothetical protein
MSWTTERGREPFATGLLLIPAPSLLGPFFIESFAYHKKKIGKKKPAERRMTPAPLIISITFG